MALLRLDDGRAEVDALIASAQLERVPASRPQAEQILEEATIRLRSARVVLDSGDPATAAIVTYDAARLALTAVLVNEGLRATHTGGHRVLADSTRAQVGSVLGQDLRAFDRMRRQRNDAEYRSTETPPLTPDEVLEDIASAGSIVDVAARLIQVMPPY